MNQAFSIIIPLYNKAKTISNTLDSVCQLSGADYEVVVVDDGSTDDGPDIVAQYPSERIKLLRKPNGGVSSARNYGAQHATNPWLIFLDADDLLLPDCLMVFGDMIERYPHDEVFVGNFVQKQGGRMVTMYCNKEFVSENPCRDIWYAHFYLRPGSFCCSYHAFKISGGYDERMSFNEDYEYCIRLAKMFRVVASPKIVMEYVTDENEGRIKVHPLKKNFSYYIPCLNISDRYVRNKFYRTICAAIERYNEAGDIESARVLDNIKMLKFGRFYPIVAWFYYQTWLNIRRIRLFKHIAVP